MQAPCLLAKALPNPQSFLCFSESSPVMYDIMTNTANTREYANTLLAFHL